MTRVNCGIDPDLLPTKLLLAEHREIIRIPNGVRGMSPSRVMRQASCKFTLGRGHVKFFRNKLLYVQRRYQSIYQECIARECNVVDMSSAFKGIDKRLFRDYQPTWQDCQLVLNRLLERGFTISYDI